MADTRYLDWPFFEPRHAELARTLDDWAGRHIADTHGADVDARNRYGCTPLFYAVNMQRREVVELLLSKNAGVDISDNTGWTLVHEAAEKEDAEILRLLIAHGANVNVKDKNGETPLNISSQRDAPDITEILETSGAKE